MLSCGHTNAYYLVLATRLNSTQLISAQLSLAQLNSAQLSSAQLNSTCSSGSSLLLMLLHAPHVALLATYYLLLPTYCLLPTITSYLLLYFLVLISTSQ